MIVQIIERNRVDALQHDNLVGLKHRNSLQFLIVGGLRASRCGRGIYNQGCNVIIWLLLDKHLANIALRQAESLPGLFVSRQLINTDHITVRHEHKQLKVQNLRVNRKVV